MWPFRKRENTIETNGKTHVYVSESMLVVYFPLDPERGGAEFKKQLTECLPGAGPDITVLFRWKK